MIITNKKGFKFNQKKYDFLFHNIEYNLRETGFGDVTVNKKMKEFNKILYDILLKIDLNKKDNKTFKINSSLMKNYFVVFKDKENTKLAQFNDYFSKFYDFCFELPLNNMIEESIKFKI